MLVLRYTLELDWIMKDCVFFQLQKGFLYSDLYFGVNWALLLDLSFFRAASDWTFLKEILWQASHTLALFPIKKPFCRGSSGSHASKYIHFHRKCFVLEVQCFLGLLCSHSAQVGFLSYVCWTPAPPPHPHTHSALENTNKTWAPIPVWTCHLHRVCNRINKTKKSSVHGGCSLGEFHLAAYVAGEQTNKTQSSTSRQEEPEV